MSVKQLEIIPWVKFNSPGIKEDLEKLATQCSSKMQFLREVKEKYDLSMSDADVVATKFFKKEVQ